MSKELKLLADVNWLHLGTTNEYKSLKKFIADICNDVTKAACIDEICINDICVGFRQRGYEVVSKSEINDLRAELAAARAEAERLRGIIREAEWSDMTMVDNRPYLFAPACPICEVEKGNEHGDYCPFYQWKGDVL